jgi:hypothetical protein
MADSLKVTMTSHVSVAIHASATLDDVMLAIKETKRLMDQGFTLEDNPFKALTGKTLEFVKVADPAMIGVSDENLNRPVEELELSFRAYNCLKNGNIETIGQLVDKTEAELLATKNFGRKTISEIKEALSDMGLSLKRSITASA